MSTPPTTASPSPSNPSDRDAGGRCWAIFGGGETEEHHRRCERCVSIEARQGGSGQSAPVQFLFVLEIPVGCLLEQVYDVGMDGGAYGLDDLRAVVASLDGRTLDRDGLVELLELHDRLEAVVAV